jgi:hypothetical protein
LLNQLDKKRGKKVFFILLQDYPILMIIMNLSVLGGILRDLPEGKAIKNA